jgi:MerR family transcriptional regulator, copper efflux regulator
LRFKRNSRKAGDMAALKIGELAERTGTSAPTVRYYEQIGLLRPASRQRGNQRVYGPGDVERLTFIRRCRDFDFSIDEIRVLVSILEDGASSCMDARDLAAAHLEAVRAKMRELKALERSLVGFVNECDLECAGVPGPECVILGDLGRPIRGGAA